MKKAWAVIGIIVLVAVLLGAVCMGVGAMTGADTARIYSVLDGRYSLSLLIEVYGSYFHELASVIGSAFMVG